MKVIRVRWRKLRSYLRESSGVSTVEYALIVVAVIAIVGVGVGVLGDSFDALFEDLKTELTNAASKTMSAAGG